LNFSPDIIKVIKLRGVRWEANVARMGFDEKSKHSYGWKNLKTLAWIG